MIFKKSTWIVLSMTVSIGICVTAFTPPEEKFKNLRVLPKNISSKDLNRIMVDDFTDGLGVSCGFCHVEDKESHQMDYSSDANPEKKIARQMMLMATNINKHYFKVRHPVIGDSALVVTCYSCHKGVVYPDAQ